MRHLRRWRVVIWSALTACVLLAQQPCPNRRRWRHRRQAVDRRAGLHRMRTYPGARRNHSSSSHGRRARGLGHLQPLQALLLLLVGLLTAAAAAGAVEASSNLLDQWTACPHRPATAIYGGCSIRRSRRAWRPQDWMLLLLLLDVLLLLLLLLHLLLLQVARIQAHRACKLVECRPRQRTRQVHPGAAAGAAAGAWRSRSTGTAAESARRPEPCCTAAAAEGAAFLQQGSTASHWGCPAI